MNDRMNEFDWNTGGAGGPEPEARAAAPAGDAQPRQAEAPGTQAESARTNGPAQGQAQPQEPAQPGGRAYAPPPAAQAYQPPYGQPNGWAYGQPYAPYGQPGTGYGPYPPYQQPYQQRYAPYGQQPYAPFAQPGAPYGRPGAGAPPMQPPVRPYRAGKPEKKRRGRGGLYLAGGLVFLVVFCTLCGLAARMLKAGEPQLSAPSAFTIEPLPEDLDGGLSTQAIAEKVSSSVVAVQAYARGLFSISAGSGIIMNEDGYIITNAHVVEGASSAMVMLEDGRELVATIVGADANTDLAVLRVTASDLVPAEFGDSDALVVGERAVAIGNAAGYLTGTTTQGCISGLNRSLDFEDAEGNVYTLNLIQTDASINPGNSGGALVNRYGQVIGINTARLADNDYQGIGFAIPITDAKPVLESLIATGRAPGRPLLGVTILALTPVTGPANGLPSQGLYIREMTPECSLWAQGVLPGDVIVSANGEAVAQTEDLTQLIADAAVGDTLELEIYLAATGETVTVTATLYEEIAD